MEFDELSRKIIGLAIEVHRELGPGLLENVYSKCLEKEFEMNGMKCETEKEIPVYYKGQKVDCGYRIDIIVENKILIELKSVEKILPIHQAQILTYMKLTGIKVGLLINFNEMILKNGLKRFVL